MAKKNSMESTKAVPVSEKSTRIGATDSCHLLQDLHIRHMAFITCSVCLSNCSTPIRITINNKLVQPSFTHATFTVASCYDTRTCPISAPANRTRSRRSLLHHNDYKNQSTTALMVLPNIELLQFCCIKPQPKP